MVLMYMTRMNINIAIIGMAKAPPSSSNISVETVRVSGACPAKYNKSDELREIEFDWAESDQMIMVGCYYYGYVLCHLAGGSLAFKFGFKRIVLISSIAAMWNQYNLPYKQD